MVPRASYPQLAVLHWQMTLALLLTAETSLFVGFKTDEWGITFATFHPFQAESKAQVR